MKSFNIEDKANKDTSQKIELIAKTGLKLSEFFTLLWSEGYKLPDAWPVNGSGTPLSPTSARTRALLPEVNRLVSAMGMRIKRESDKQKDAQEKAKKEKDARDKKEKDKISKAKEKKILMATTTDPLDKELLTGQLRALLVESFDGNEKIYTTTKDLMELLITEKL